MAIVHIVLFEFQPGVEPAAVEAICKSLLALKHNCKHPSTGAPYILDAVGGRDNSPEGLQGGLSHGFVFHFESVEDRNYYLEKDPAHAEFVRSVKGIAKNVRVVDFNPGVF